VVEEIPRLFVDGDIELGGERTDQRTRQLGVGGADPVDALGPDTQRVFGVDLPKIA